MQRFIITLWFVALSLQCTYFNDGRCPLWNQIDNIGVSHIDPLRKEYPELASMLADPPPLVGKRVRFLAVVKDQHGEVERARARAWTDTNIEAYRNMSKEDSKAIAPGFMTKLVTMIGTGAAGAMQETMNVEEC